MLDDFFKLSVSNLFVICDELVYKPIKTNYSFNITDSRKGV